MATPPVGAFSPLNKVNPDPNEPDWSLPDDILHQNWTAGLETLPDDDHDKSASDSSKVQKSDKVNLPYQKMERKLKNSNEIFSTFEILLSKLEIEINRLNDEGAKLFSLSQYDEAVKSADDGKALQGFKRKVEDLNSEWTELRSNASEGPRSTDQSSSQTMKDRDVPSVKSKRAPKKRLLVVFKDGGVVDEETAASTFAKTISLIGMEKVKNLDLSVNHEPLISEIASEKYNTAFLDGHHVMTHSSTKHKYEILEKISTMLGIELRVAFSE